MPVDTFRRAIGIYRRQSSHAISWMRSFFADVKLEWHDTDPLIARKHARAVKMSVMGLDLQDPSYLCFHSVFLGGGHDGPSVFVWGEEGSDAYHCEYQPVTKWDSFPDLDDEDA